MPRLMPTATVHNLDQTTYWEMAVDRAADVLIITSEVDGECYLRIPLTALRDHDNQPLQDK